MQAPVDDQPMTVLEVRRDAIKIVVSKAQSRILEGMQRRGGTPLAPQLVSGLEQAAQAWGGELQGVGCISSMLS